MARIREVTEASRGDKEEEEEEEKEKEEEEKNNRVMKGIWMCLGRDGSKFLGVSERTECSIVNIDDSGIKDT